MDIDGNGQVSYKELIETAKSSLEAAKKMNNETMPPEVLRVSHRGLFLALHWRRGFFVECVLQQRGHIPLKQHRSHAARG